MSGQTRWKAAAVSLALAVVACQPELTVEEDRTLQSVTTPSVTESTVTTSPTAPTSTASPEGDFVVTPCGEVSEALVCEAYELIQRHYLDADV